MAPVNKIPAGDLGDDLLVLSLNQARHINQFRTQIRLCETDTEKYELCAQTRDDVLERHTEVQLLIAAYEHIIVDECVGYKEWKEKGGEGQGLPIKTREDAAKWERFADVARGGSEVKSRCIGPLKTVNRYWGADFVQHYQLASKGVRYCEVTGAAAREVRDLDEAVTKLNRLMLRRHLATGRGLRRPREVVNPIDQADLVNLKAWSHRDSFDKGKDSLPYRKLAAADLPPGFGFDKFGLMVFDAVLAHEEPNGPSAANESSENASSTERYAGAAHSSSLACSQSTTPLSSPPKSPPLAAFTVAGVLSGDAVRDLADISSSGDSDADDRLHPERQPSRQILRSRASTDKSCGRAAAENAQNADRQHATNASAARLRARSGKPGYHEAPPRRSKPLRQPELLSTARLQERCCPPKISSTLLAFLDKMDGIATGQMPTFILVGVPFQNMCHTHLKKYTEAVTSTESFGSSPKAEELQTASLDTSDTPRRRRASLSELIDTTPLKRLRSADQDASGHSYLPATTSLNGRPKHDSIRDEAYRRRVLKDMELTEHEPNSWGSQTDALVSQILSKSRPPTGEDTYFLSGEEAAQRAELGSVDVPIFTQGQQRFQWKGKDRPISQLFYHMEDLGLDQTVSVQVPSRSSLKESSERKTLFQVRNRFLGQRSTSDPWNLLDLQGSLPSTLPSFLEGDNCQLLLRMRDAILMGNDAQRIAASGEDWNTWRNVVEWALLSEGGHNTASHMDSHGYSTWITVQEGNIGFGWMSRPSQQKKNEWIANPHGYTGGEWRYVILSPGHTVFFPSGTIHFVFRVQGVQTFALGGHVLQWPGIKRWLKVVVAQLKNPEITNEDMASSAPKYVQVVKRLVANRMKAGRVEEMGGRDAVARLSALLKDFDSVAGGSRIKMSKPRTPLRQQKGDAPDLVHSIPCQPPRRLLPTCAPKRSA
ncbi:hypothetical protein RB599_010966 [Gaeumannomyces hyphopodioides]